MDDRAYHLQTKAHRAVARALRIGALSRRPCEVCGSEAQAHHDSYYPEKWLAVRWLCGSHHKQWHDENEPRWPTIYEFHPSDAHYRKSSTQRVGSAVGKTGPVPRPWLKRSTGTWYVWIGKKQISLGRDYKDAQKRCNELLMGENPPVTR